jgi:hypothetical protein
MPVPTRIPALPTSSCFNKKKSLAKDTFDKTQTEITTEI